jgi:DNA-binding LacI/PurR family transcriptional regulator
VNLSRPYTARARLVTTLAQEILSRPDTVPFAIASEHALCRRFQISRVTVRLALGDLENRGLIYRKHGKGTFAYGRTQQIYRDIGFLMKAPQAAEHRPVAELVRGARTVMTGLGASIVLLSRSPEDWRPDVAGSLAGVIVMSQDVSEKDLQVLQDRKVPFLLAGRATLPGPHIDLGLRIAARARTEQLLELGHRRIALLSGYDVSLDDSKREGIFEAFHTAGIDPASIPEFSAGGEEGAILQAVRNLFQHRPHPTAVIAFDDSLAAMLSFVARHQGGIQIPAELSIVSFHDWAYLHSVEPTLNTVHFEFFGAGQRAAEVLNHAALTGEPVDGISFEPTYRAGETLAPPPYSANGAV